MEIKEALGLKRGEMVDAEQGKILIDSVRAMERGSGIKREHLTAQVKAYLANKAHEAATASKTGVTAASLLDLLRPSVDPARSWRKDATVARRAGDITNWTKTCEPEDPSDKSSDLAERERMAAVLERRARWMRGFEFFNTKFGLGPAEHAHVMTLWWDTEPDWTPPRRGSRAPYWEKTHDLWNIEDDRPIHKPQPPPLPVLDECGTGETSVIANVAFGTVWPNSIPTLSDPPIRPNVWEQKVFGRPPNTWTSIDYDE